MPNNGLWDGSIAALLGALSGGAVSWIIASRSEGRARRARYYERFEDSLDAAQMLAIDYWRASGIDAEKERQLIAQLEVLDVRVEAVLRGVSNDSLSQAVTGLIDGLSEDVTGGSFQTAGRRRDAMRVQSIKNRCRQLKDLLHGI